MVRKTFLWNFKNQEFINKKSTTKELFSKSFIRDVLIDNKQIKIIDNGSRISDFFLKKRELKTKTLKSKFKSFKKFKKGQKKGNKFKKSIKSNNKKNLRKNKYKIGASLNIEHRILRHKFWDKIRIEVPAITNAKPANIFNILKNAKKATQRDCTKGKYLPVQILKPIKGGFKVRSAMLKGFLSNKDYKNAKKAFNKKLIFRLQNLEKKLLNSAKNIKVLTFKKNTFKSGSKSFNLRKIFDSEMKKWNCAFEEKKNILKKTITNNFLNVNVTKRLPLQLSILKPISRVKKAIYVKKRKLGSRRKIFFKRKRRKNFINTSVKYAKHSLLKRIKFFYKNPIKKVFKNIKKNK